MDETISSTFWNELVTKTNGTELFIEFIKDLPYPVQIYSANGLLVAVNKPFLQEFHISDEGSIVGKYKLADSNLSVGQAFEACGLHYHSYYARLFRTQTGCSPSEYRRQEKVNMLRQND